MTGTHGDIGPELRQLAQFILDRIDPAVRAAAARAVSEQPGACQQVWCPVCALAALINGEQHPLLSVVAEHSVALLAVVRMMVGTPDQAGAAEPPAPPAPEHPSGPVPEAEHDSKTNTETTDTTNTNGRYQTIPVTVED
ncbi:MAG TPA: hypothetical protein P5061_06485 [Mycobacterium sp.]|nr:hypothetical protein [Mycobacterium sp.]